MERRHRRHEHVEQSRSRDHYVAWQRERLLAMLHAGRRAPRRARADPRRPRRGPGGSGCSRRTTRCPACSTTSGPTACASSVCSNWDWDLEPAIAEAGLDGRFDTLVSSAWAGARKPHPRIYRYLLDQTGLDPDDVLFVGDTWGPDVEGPLAAGMTPAYLERDGHWPDATKPDDTSGRRGRTDPRPHRHPAVARTLPDGAGSHGPGGLTRQTTRTFCASSPLRPGTRRRTRRPGPLPGCGSRCPGWPRSGRTHRGRPHGR